MEQLDVKILDREFRLAVSPEEKARLLEAVRVVDEKMRSIRDTGRVAGLDRIAVMAALQLAHELLGARSSGNDHDSGETIRRIRKMTAELDAEIKRQETLF
jgi:cell division protein ZapA